MYDILLPLHSIVRWLALLGAILAAGAAIWGWLGRREWKPLDDRLGLVFTISLDVQLLLGILLYFVSPLVQSALADFGEAMSSTPLRFYAVEHAFLMIVAVVLAHVGRALAKRAEDARAKHQRAAIFFTLALLAILIAIPWPFREPFGALGRALFPGL